MHTRWTFGDPVRLTRNVRDDGTYPGANAGDLLVRCGSIGNVVDIGTFLFDQIIYSVHFLDGDRVVGCREEELIDIDEPWVDSAFDTRQFVRARCTLALGGEISIAAGTRGEIMHVVRESAPASYHVHFDSLPGRIFQVAESALLADDTPAGSETPASTTESSNAA